MPIILVLFYFYLSFFVGVSVCLLPNISPPRTTSTSKLIVILTMKSLIEIYHTCTDLILANALPRQSEVEKIKMIYWHMCLLQAVWWVPFQTGRLQGSGHCSYIIHDVVPMHLCNTAQTFLKLQTHRTSNIWTVDHMSTVMAMLA